MATARMEVATPSERLIVVAERQHGVFSRRQAIDCGFTKSQIATRVGTQWARVLPGVYRLRGMPLVWESSVTAASLWVGAEGALSHISAGRFWGLPVPDPKIIDVSLRVKRHPPPGLRVHCGELGPSDIVVKGSVRVTSVARTLLDIAGIADATVAEACLDEALRRRLVTLTRMKHLLGAQPRGTRGTACLKRLLRQRDPSQRPTESELERVVIRTIRKAGLPLPDQQIVISDAQGRFARVDFVYQDLKIIIEADSFTHHSDRQDWSADMRRRNRLTREGWRVYHGTYWDMKDRPHELVSWLWPMLVDDFAAKKPTR